jgi:hypothetical protein
MAVEVRATMGVSSSDPLRRRGFVSRSARRSNGDTVQIYGDFRWEIEAVRKHLMRTARSTGMKMLAIAQLEGWAEMESTLTTDQQEEERYMAAQLAVVETETVELPSLGSVVPDPADIVDLSVAMEAFVRDVIRGNELLVEPVTLETALAVSANLYRWAQFWVVRHPNPKMRERFAAALGEGEPLRRSLREKAERMVAKWKERGFDA